MNLRKQETLEKNSSHRPTMIYQAGEKEDNFPLIMKVECNEEEIIA